MSNPANRVSMLVFSISIMLLSPPLAAEVVPPKDGSGRPGDFTVGPWQGRCIRDGWLNGAKNESCSVRLTAEGRTIFLSRTTKNLVATLNVDDCDKGVFKAKMGIKQLADKGRATRLQTLVNGLFEKEDHKCGDPSAWAVPISQEDLADILRETDGLDF